MFIESKGNKENFAYSENYCQFQIEFVLTYLENILTYIYLKITHIFSNDIDVLHKNDISHGIRPSKSAMPKHIQSHRYSQHANDLHGATKKLSHTYYGFMCSSLMEFLSMQMGWSQSLVTCLVFFSFCSLVLFNPSVLVFILILF